MIQYPTCYEMRLIEVTVPESSLFRNICRDLLKDFPGNSSNFVHIFHKRDVVGSLIDLRLGLLTSYFARGDQPEAYRREVGFVSCHPTQFCRIMRRRP